MFEAGLRWPNTLLRRDLCQTGQIIVVLRGCELPHTSGAFDKGDFVKLIRCALGLRACAVPAQPTCSVVRSFPQVTHLLCCITGLMAL